MDATKGSPQRELYGSTGLSGTKKTNVGYSTCQRGSGSWGVKELDVRKKVCELLLGYRAIKPVRVH